MTATRKGRSITMTADNDAYTGAASINGVSFQGSGLTAGQRLRLTDTGGSVIVDYLVQPDSNNVDNADLWGGRGPEFYQGLLLEDGPAAGTWVLTVFLE